MWDKKLFASVFALSREPILIVDRKTRTILNCNPAVRPLFGWSPAELIGKSTSLLTASLQSWQDIPANFAAAMDAGEFAELRMLGQHRDGTTFPVHVRGTSFEDDGVVFNVLYLSDLTEIERANEKLRNKTFELEERNKELKCIYRISEALADTHIPLETRIIRLPTYMKAGWQFPEHTHVRIELRGLDCATSDYREGIARQQSTIRVGGAPVGTVTVAYDIEAPPAAEGPFMKEERTLLDDVAKRIGAAIERSNAETERRRTNARLHFISQHLPLSIVISDWRTGEIVFLNPKARRDLGISDDAPLSQLNVRSLYENAEDRAKLRTRFEADGRLIGYQVRLRIQGALRWNAIYAERIDFEGRPAVYTVRIDVTEQRDAEEILQRTQKLETIGQLAGGVAHDFNNVLTALSMQFELLGEEPGLSASARKGIEIASSAVDRGAAVTRQLLSFARKTELRPDRADIGALVAGMQAFLARTLGGHIRVAVEKPNAPVWAYLDEGLFENAVLNLAINARDAMPAGGNLKIAVSDCRVAPEEGRMSGTAAGRYVEVAVTDTGTGMTPEVLDRVFEPFFTTKDVGHGTGLGLSMVHGFVKQSGGFAKIESALGRGTTVRLFFPHREEAVAAAEARRDAAVPRGHERILLVDDDDLVRQSIAQQLRAHGYSVAVAQGGAEALRLLDEARPELLISDVMMPGMLGTSLAEEVRLRMPSLPILIVSGSYESDHRQTLRPLSPIDFCEKPFAFSALAQKVRRLLDSSIPPAKEHR